MTMQNSIHPADERLAALAGDDPRAVADRGLRQHVETCDRCTTVLAELHALRSALADLPDVAPPRPLQLVPPLSATPERRGWLGRLRGFAAPAMALGGGLAIVGAVGLGGLASGGIGAAGGAPAMVDESAGRGAAEGASAAPNDYQPLESEPVATSAAPAAQSTASAIDTLTDTSTPLPWLVLLASGGALVVAGLVLRFAVNPRAG